MKDCLAIDRGAYVYEQPSHINCGVAECIPAKLRWCYLSRSAREAKCKALWYSRELNIALKCIRTYFYMRVHVSLCTFAWVCIWSNCGVKPLLISLHTSISTFLHNKNVCSEHFLKLSRRLYNGLIYVPRKIRSKKLFSILTPHDFCYNQRRFGRDDITN